MIPTSRSGSRLAVLARIFAVTATLAIQVPVARHYRKYPILGSNTFGGGQTGQANRTTWRHEVDALKSWLAERLEWMDGAPQATNPTALAPRLKPTALVEAVTGRSQAGGNVPLGFQFRINNPNPAGGTTYYTIDGADPRQIGGSLDPSALTAATGTVTTSTILAAGQPWKWLLPSAAPANDAGGLAWTASTYADAAWSAGAAPLGYGETTGLATNVSPVPPNYPSATVAPGAAYFRTTFNATDTTGLTSTFFEIMADDGAVIYLNGVEVFCSNMPTGAVTYATLAMLAQDDGMSLYAGPVDHALLYSENNVLAVEVHQNAITSSDVSFDLELLANVVFQRPTVAITSPVAGSVLGSPTVVLVAEAADADGVITMVEFIEGENVLGVATNAPFVLTNFNTAPGNHAFTAVAVDSTGLSATSAPVVITVVPALVPSRANWKYLDDGSEPAAAWITAAFDDSGWSNGVAQFGFGEGDEATMIRRFSELTESNIVAYYFRHAFAVPDPAAIASLTVRLLRDDGGIVYLNGTEIFRNNLPAGPVDSTTLALIVAEDSEYRAVRVNPQLLLAGQNVIAVEVHQVNLTSSDVSFDLELLPNLAARRPVVAITEPENNEGFLGPISITASALATDVDDAVADVTFYLDGYPAGSTSAEPYSVLLENLLGNHTLVAVATDSLGLSSTSAPVNIGIAAVTSLVSTGAVWNYLDTGIDQGTNWRSADFDDSTWPSGPAKLGTNDAPATIIRIYNANGQPVRTSYYRHHFRK